LEKKKIAGFIATDRESYRDRQQPGARGLLPEGATRVDRMRRKLQIKVGAAIYSRRKTVVEPVFGQIKQARGFRQFLLRGLDKVQGEWAVICLTHNILSYTGSAMDRRERERPLIKMKAALGKLFCEHGSELGGENSHWQCSQLGSRSLQRLSKAILGRAPREPLKNSPIHRLSG
jgi:hypothetical protein